MPDANDIKLFVATKAFIVHEGKVLVVREAKYENGTNVGRFGIPGGRAEKGERFDDALRREAKEETGLEIEIGEPLYVQEWGVRKFAVSNGKLWLSFLNVRQRVLM